MRKMVIIVVFLISCQSDYNKEIALYDDVKFELKNKEQKKEITKKIKDDYFLFVEKRQMQIPLYRYIKGSNYAIYIGLPFNAEISDFSNTKLFEDKSCLATKSKADLFEYTNYKLDTLFVTEYVYKKRKNLVYILTATDDKSIQKSLFQYEDLSNRIKYEE